MTFKVFTVTWTYQISNAVIEKLLAPFIAANQSQYLQSMGEAVASDSKRYTKDGKGRSWGEEKKTPTGVMWPRNQNNRMPVPVSQKKMPVPGCRRCSPSYWGGRGSSVPNGGMTVVGREDPGGERLGNLLNAVAYLCVSHPRGMVMKFIVERERETACRESGSLRSCHTPHTLEDSVMG
jgi:hypothetical protein